MEIALLFYEPKRNNVAKREGAKEKRWNLWILSDINFARYNEGRSAKISTNQSDFFKKSSVKNCARRVNYFQV